MDPFGDQTGLYPRWIRIIGLLLLVGMVIWGLVETGLPELSAFQGIQGVFVVAPAGALAGGFVGAILGLITSDLYERYEQWKGVDLSKYDIPLSSELVPVTGLAGAVVGLVVGVIVPFMI